ncbi:MAG: ribose-phosphate diphosphokinase [Rickettsiaceae bacterium]|nr:ribose-phosphate diphosphokinase [Rickettsiaceae bacterium]
MKQILSSMDDLTEVSNIAQIINASIISFEIKNFTESEKLIELSQIPEKNSEIIIFKKLWPKPNDSLIELLILLDQLVNSDIYNISLIIPFIPYLRQDRQFTPKSSVGARAIANLLSHFPINNIYTFDPHSEAACYYFSGGVVKLNYYDYFAHKLKELKIEPENTLIIAPDLGALSRAKHFSEIFGTKYAYLKKMREGENISIQPLSDAKKYDNIVIIDDMIDSGGTILSAIKALEAKYEKIIICISRILKESAIIDINTKHPEVTIISPSNTELNNYEKELIYRQLESV